MEQVFHSEHRVTETYWSMAEFADHAAKHDHIERHSEWRGRKFTMVGTFEEAHALAVNGWGECLNDTLTLAEHAIETASKDHVMESFNQPEWDVTGSQVDVGAFLAGTPECMIEYPLSETSKAGRVITLVASFAFSGSLKTGTIVKRGQLVTALALALGRLGHGVEIWIDFHLGTLYQRVCVKNVNDEVDPARLLYGLAHPSVLRVLEFATQDALKSTGHHVTNSGYGPIYPRTPDQMDMFPEETIFLPEICSDHDVPEAAQFLEGHLRLLGLLAE